MKDQAVFFRFAKWASRFTSRPLSFNLAMFAIPAWLDRFRAKYRVLAERARSDLSDSANDRGSPEVDI